MANKEKQDSAPVYIRERRIARGLGGGHTEERVRVLEPGEPIPDGAQVTDDLPGDWAPVPS